MRWLGCGGALAQLAAAGAHVTVMFLSDSAGAPGDAGDGPDYSARRRQESEAACALLGIAQRVDLGLPDGALAQPQHVRAAADAIEAFLRAASAASAAPAAPAASASASTLPLDLLFVPSPSEITLDHQAACAALHEAIQRLRGSHDDTIRRLDVLLYEVNHSSHPDLLVDVSAQVGVIESAMACYASQQARHDYLAAALGHRRFRTLTLPTGVTHAEGYRRLSAWDFATRSLAQLVAFAGGAAPYTSAREDESAPLVCVIVRTRDRPRLLREALESLAGGVYRHVEVVLVNDGGVPPVLPGADADANEPSASR
jgi:LmbE family N-acetylglucosaminyl deacetylase